MLDDPCPQCGHRRKPQMMSTNPEFRDVSLSDMWSGDGEPWQQMLLRLFVFVLIFLFFAFAVIPNIPS